MASSFTQELLAMKSLQSTTETEEVKVIPGEPQRLPEKNMGAAVIVDRHPNAKKLTNKKKDSK